MPRRRCRFVVSYLMRCTSVAAIIFMAAGCGREDPTNRVAAMNDSNIKRLANLYMAHQMRRGSKGPANEAAFKEFIKNGMAPHRLEMMQVNPNNADALFISERDGQPFVVRYGLSGGTMTALPVVFEQQGEGGKRLVAFTNGSVEEVDAARYEELLEGKDPAQPVGKSAQ